MKKYFFTITAISTLFIIASASSCNNDQDANTGCVATQPDPNVFCTMHYAPVCGCNQVTYSNTCTAEASGIVNYTVGACQ